MLNLPRSHFQTPLAAIATPARWGGFAPSAGVSADAPVMTPHGPVPAIALNEGDRVLVRDGGEQPVLWRRDAVVLDCVSLSGRDGALELGAAQDLVLSDPQIASVFGFESALVAAHLVAASNLNRPVRIVELMLPVPAAMCVAGHWITSFCPDAAGLARLTALERRDLFASVPRLRHEATRASHQPIGARLTASDLKRLWGPAISVREEARAG